MINLINFLFLSMLTIIIQNHQASFATITTTTKITAFPDLKWNVIFIIIENDCCMRNLNWNILSLSLSLCVYGNFFSFDTLCCCLFQVYINTHTMYKRSSEVPPWNVSMLRERERERERNVSITINGFGSLSSTYHHHHVDQKFDRFEWIFITIILGFLYDK